MLFIIDFYSYDFLFLFSVLKYWLPWQQMLDEF